MWLLAVVVVASVSCMKVLDHNDDICDYTVQIYYHYNQENTSGSVNMIEHHVFTIDEYIFDEGGVLVAINPVDRDVCDGTWHSDLDLPPGKYTVISVGNRDARSFIGDRGNGNAAPVRGVTRRGDMTLTHTNTVAYADHSERLYYGYRTFSVEPNNVSKIRMDMVHSHHVLRFRIRWKRNAPPMGDYTATMSFIPSEYTLMPHYVYPEQYQCETHDPNTHDEYNRICQAVRHHIPTVHQDRNILNHKVNLKRNVDGEIRGEFIMYRIKNESTPTMALFSGSSPAGTQIMKDINLQKYFSDRNINLDQTLKQEYDIDILIDDGSVFVSPINVADWNDGGKL